MFLLKLNFFSYLLSLIIALFQLALTTGLHLHLTIWIFYLRNSIPPFFLILSFLVFSTLIFSPLQIHPLRPNWMSYLILLTLSKSLMFPLISLTLIHLPLLILFFSHLTLTLPSCSILHSVTSSDNFSILFSLPTYSVNSPSPSPPRKVWLYHLADFECANALLCSIDWKEIQNTNTNTSIRNVFQIQIL